MTDEYNRFDNHEPDEEPVTPPPLPRSEPTAGPGGNRSGGSQGDYVPPQMPVMPQKQTRRSGMRTFLIICLVFVFIFGGIYIGAKAFLNVLTGSGEGGSLGYGSKIGLVRIEGMIMQSSDKDFWIDSLKKMGESEHIPAVVVRIDSPGGTVGASQELQRALIEVRTKFGKPVFVSMGDVSASGGYYIASAADRIYALPGTITGSIGVIFSIPQYGELSKKIGIDREVIKSGRFKDAGNSMREMTESERLMFQQLIGNTYDQFVGDILAWRRDIIEQAARSLPAERWAEYQFTRPESLDAESFLREVADGRVYTGQQAIELGLVDFNGTLNDVIEDAAAQVGLSPDVKVFEPVRKPTLAEMLGVSIPDVLPSMHPAIEYRFVP